VALTSFHARELSISITIYYYYSHQCVDIKVIVTEDNQKNLENISAIIIMMM
jgi:hypothetical protein